jgi:hypothetical protein
METWTALTIDRSPRSKASAGPGPAFGTIAGSGNGHPGHEPTRVLLMAHGRPTNAARVRRARGHAPQSQTGIRRPRRSDCQAVAVPPTAGGSPDGAVWKSTTARRGLPT